ncbi:hypothetical protein [Paractinoplanes lichenicola]|uniref:Uncharacterized protein n=1 Tax=Paractinoplanes lichenicola TaxID=2802976 RepID=A0ABS1VZV5_9ACTN|nr:hypothetical protein [Actinoplanes lichenicola]MBL7260024.1 hypothetical protein [Actinoplanes lichenicola]
MATAWSVLTDGARARYGDVAGFRPVFDRLGKSLGGTDGQWHAVDDRWRSGAVVLVRLAGGAHQVWPMLAQVPLGRLGQERIDPEPPKLRLTAVRAGDAVRVEGADNASYVVIDSVGRQSHPSRRSGLLTFSRPLPDRAVVVAIEESAAGLRVGVAGV